MCSGASDETMDVSRDMAQLLECSMEYINDKGSTDTVDEKLESDFPESLVSFIKQKQTGNIETEHDIYEDENFETPGPERERNEDGDKPIQPGHWLSLKSGVLLIWLYAIVHSLSASEISDLLT